MKKNAFTLIELLAVIVILAVISLIVTPIVSGLIHNAKESADMRSAEGYVTAVKSRLLTNLLGSNKLEDGVYTVDELESKNVEFTGSKPTDGSVAILNGSVVSADLVFNGTNINVNSFGVASASSKVYGLKWNGGSVFTRLSDAADMNSCVGTDTETCISDFDNAEIYNEMHDVNVDGNAFVYIPKFYIKKVVTDNQWEWYISKTKQYDSYYLPACFYDVSTSKELPYVLIGKYGASLSSDGTKLISVAGNAPLTSHSLDEFRTLSKKNNTETVKGYQLFDIHAIDVIQTLFYIEFATLDSQTIMMGHTNDDATIQIKSIDGANYTLTSGGGASYRVGEFVCIASSSSSNLTDNLLITGISGDTLTIENTKWTSRTHSIVVNDYVMGLANITGETDKVQTKSGSSVSNTDGFHSMKYRGIENIFGDMWQGIDGVTLGVDGTSIYVNRNSETYASNKITGDYVKIGYSRVNTTGYVTKMGFDSSNPFVSLPTETSATGISASIYGIFSPKKSNSLNMNLSYGGANYSLTNAGIGDTTFLQYSSNTYTDTGTRLQKKPI